MTVKCQYFEEEQDQEHMIEKEYEWIKNWNGWFEKEKYFYGM